MKILIFLAITFCSFILQCGGQTTGVNEPDGEIVPAFLKKERKQIIGTWVGENEKLLKWKFTKDGKLFEWYGRDRVSVSKYCIKNKGPYCDIQNDTSEKYPEFSVLEIDNPRYPGCFCYIINNTLEVLSLMTYYDARILVMVRPKKKVQLKNVRK